MFGNKHSIKLPSREQVGIVDEMCDVGNFQSIVVVIVGMGVWLGSWDFSATDVNGIVVIVIETSVKGSVCRVMFLMVMRV